MLAGLSVNRPSMKTLRPRTVHFLFNARVRVANKRAKLQQSLTLVEHPRIGPLTPSMVEHLLAPAHSIFILLALLVEKQTLRKTCPCPLFALNVQIDKVTFVYKVIKYKTTHRATLTHAQPNRGRPVPS